MSASKSDLDRIYWSLAVLGPMTLSELQKWTNWTKHRTNDALQRLKRAGCVQLMEPYRHLGAYWNNGSTGRARCGKWVAVKETQVSDSPVVDALLETA